MRFSEVEINALVKFICRQLGGVGLSAANNDKAAESLKNIIFRNIEEEKALEEDALKLLKQHRSAMGASIDEDKALRMIKDKLAKDRGFVL